MWGLQTFVLNKSDVLTRREVALRGAKFGFIVYGIYDATCASIFDDWDIPLSILDVLWGTFVYGTAAAIAKP